MANTRCYLLELPAELRLRCWEAALAPTGSLFLTRNRDKLHKVEPIISPALLRTCHQIHDEAAPILYEQNSVCLSVNINDNAFPLIPKSRLPQAVLAKLQHMCLILDGCSFYAHSGPYESTYDDVDWNAVTALTSLKTVRLTVLAVALPPRPICKDEVYFTAAKKYCQDLLREVVERVPASTKITYGTGEGSAERDIVTSILKRYNDYPVSDHEAGEVDGESLALAASTMEAEAGCKSGSVADVFEERHQGAMWTINVE
jgi:hypothetical protein